MVVCGQVKSENSSLPVTVRVSKTCVLKLPNNSSVIVDTVLIEIRKKNVGHCAHLTEKELCFQSLFSGSIVYGLCVLGLCLRFAFNFFSCHRI